MISTSANESVIGARWVLGAALAVLVRPSLWIAAIRQIGMLAVPGWWRTAPFLPLPDRSYLAFRFRTAYGDASAGPSPADVVTYLHWCQGWPHLARDPERARRSR